jgi:1,2-phenylacetyl-CoA epoxidase catalytic subunit
MRFTSEIFSHIDKNRVWVFNCRALKKKIEEMLQTMITFLWVVTGLLFMMSFFQLVVSVEGNIKDDL